MTFPPQAFIIGAQKSATTSLAFLLDQHPSITLANPKEPDFLTVHWERGIDWYRSCFRHTDGILVDASVGYTMAPVTRTPASEIVAPMRAHEISPDARFIYMVRDPARRCYSAYWHEVRAGREKRGLREAVESGAYYVSASYYFLQLSEFLKYFPLDRFLVVGFTEFSSNPQIVADKCLAFLGASPRPFNFQIGEPKNESFRYTLFGQTLQKILGNDGLKEVSQLLAQLVPTGLKPYLKRVVSSDIPDISVEDYQWLSSRFHDDSVEFERLTGVRPI